MRLLKILEKAKKYLLSIDEKEDVEQKKIEKLKDKIEDKVSFGLSYDYINQRWDVLDYETLADDSISFDYENPYTESGLYKKEWWFK